MKTIYKDGVWERADEATAKLRVNSQGWKLVPKSEWKINVRDANRKEKQTKSAEKKEVDNRETKKKK
jgi:hypothetical protein